MESYQMPWWMVQTGHGLLTGMAVTGLVTAEEPVAWLWLLVVGIALAAAEQARRDHTTEVAMVEVDGQPPAEIAEPDDRSSGW